MFERLLSSIKGAFKAGRQSRNLEEIMIQFRSGYARFDETYRLMSDDFSRQLFAELIVIKLVTEEGLHLSSFTQGFIDSHEMASQETLASQKNFSLHLGFTQNNTERACCINFQRANDPEPL